jgi:glycerol-1-phosphate dehydrogenase [NAD(P)+]
VADPSLHVIDLPRSVVVGVKVIEDLGSHLARIGFRDSGILVVTGPNVAARILPRARQALEEAGYTVWHKTVVDASTETANRIVEEIDSDRVDVIMGMGGGKSIDVAKYASYESGRPFVSIPTVASHDGITSPFASLKGFKRPVSKRAKPPVLIVIDISVISSAPRRYNIAGFGDLLGKYTAVLDWRLAHRIKGEYYGAYAASLALMSARHVSQYANEIARGTIEGYRVLVEALVSSGVAMCIAVSTRPASGSEHLFAHALNMVARNPPLHGEAVGVGTIMMSYLHGKKWRKIRRLLRRVGAPVTAKELGVTSEEVIEALVRAARIRPERYTILGEEGLNYAAAERLARSTGIIT